MVTYSLSAKKINSLKLSYRSDFVGTLIVVPDVASLNLPGAPSVNSGARHKGTESEGVRGLKSLGVRDLHHRMAYLACAVQVNSSFELRGGLTSIAFYNKFDIALILTLYHIYH